MRIGIVGGTGREGRGLALRWAKAGHEVALGSRDGERARARAAELAPTLHDGPTRRRGLIEGGSNEWAVSAAEVVVLTVPYAAHGETLRARSRRTSRAAWSSTSPCRSSRPRCSEVHLPEGQSAALEAQAILGPGTHGGRRRSTT